MTEKVTCRPARIKVNPLVARVSFGGSPAEGALRYTLRSSSDPRGRLRGGVAAVPGDAVAGGLGGNVAMGAAACGVPSTRAGWIGDAAGRPTGAVAFASPMNVAGDNMPRSLRDQR